MNILERIIDCAERPIGFGKPFDEIGGYFTSSYIFASSYVNNKDVLDIGCGSGYGASFLSTNGARSVVGIDNNRNTIARCQKYYQDASNLTFKVLDCTNLNFEDESFDTITAMELIEHLDDCGIFLREASRVLRQDGFCIIATPNKEAWSPGLKSPIIVWHKKEFYPEELRELLSKYFSEVKMFGKHNKAYLLEGTEESGMEWRLKVTRMLASVSLIRQVSRFLPLWVRQLVTGRTKTKLKATDFSIANEDMENAYSLIAVCRK